MKKLKVYLDTSAIGYLDEQSHPSEMADMLTFWDMAKQGDFEIAISEVTLAELYDNKNSDKVSALMAYLSQINYETVELSDEINEIADAIKNAGILVSDKCKDDRNHIGCAIISGSDVLLSYNFKHLANVRTVNGVRGISTLKGYCNINIVPASMLIEKGDE